MRPDLLPCTGTVLPTWEVPQHTLSENTVNLTCQVKNLDFQLLLLTWLKDRNMSHTEMASTLREQGWHLQWEELAPGEFICPQGECDAHLSGAAQ